MSYKDRDRVYAWLDAGNGEKLTTLDRAVLVMIAERANTKTGVSAPGNKEPAQRWESIPTALTGRSLGCTSSGWSTRCLAARARAGPGTSSPAK
jgi:hypothetical protein